MQLRLILIILIGLVSCKSDNTVSSGLQELDLMKYDLPIKIKAPTDAVVQSEDLGFVKDVTIKGEGNYYIQIQSGEATTTDKKQVKENLLTTVKNMRYFSKVVEDFENGFIYENNLGDDNLNYDFRVVKIQGDKEYIFQRGLMGKFSLEEVKRMYKAVE